MPVAMRITVDLDHGLWSRLESVAASRGTSVPAVVEQAIRRLLAAADAAALPPLPKWDGGGTAIDIADRDLLYKLLDDR